MKNLTIVGRILFALPFAVFGVNHFLMLDLYVGMLTSFIPLGVYTIMLTGVLLFVASISIILKKHVQLATMVLAGLLFLFIATIHIPNLFKDVNSPITMIAMLKDISLMGGALMIAGVCKNKEAEKK